MTGRQRRLYLPRRDCARTHDITLSISFSDGLEILTDMSRIASDHLATVWQTTAGLRLVAGHASSSLFSSLRFATRDLHFHDANNVTRA